MSEMCDGKVLVIDDSPTQARHLELMLEKAGFQVTTARDGVDALGHVTTEPFDLVLTDLNLPGDSGIEICRKIKEIPDLSGLPVVIATADRDPANLLRGLAVGADGFVTKDLQPAVFLMRIQLALSRKPSSAIPNEPLRVVFLDEVYDLRTSRQTLLEVLTGAFEDVVRLGEQLRASEEWTSGILSATADGIIVIGVDGMITSTNPAAERIFGISSLDATAMNLSDLLFPDDRAAFESELDRLRENPSDRSLTAEREYIGVRSNGDPVPLAMQLTAHARRDQDGFIATVQDITDRLRAREALAQEESQKRQIVMRDQFLSHVSHELRTPLTAIYQYVTILLDEIAGELTGDQREYLMHAVRNIDQLTRMIADLMDVTRAATGKLTVRPKRIGLEPVIVDAIEDLRGLALERGVALDFDLADEIPPLRADPARVRQILFNLIQNAIKFMPGQGTVMVMAAPDADDLGYVRVSVVDTGGGIEAEHLDHIFDRHFQQDEDSEAGRKGLGLGLHICKELAKSHGGRIWAESERGCGASFHFTLPVFSLEALLLPLLSRGENPQRTSALITVSSRTHSDETPSAPSEECVSQVREIVERCVLPDLDFLLPPMGTEDGQPLAAVVACTDETGVEVLSRRIREQLRTATTARAEGLALRVSSSMLEETSHVAPDRSPEAVARNVAAAIERRMGPPAEPKEG